MDRVRSKVLLHKRVVRRVKGEGTVIEGRCGLRSKGLLRKRGDRRVRGEGYPIPVPPVASPLCSTACQRDLLFTRETQKLHGENRHI